MIFHRMSTFLHICSITEIGVKHKDDKEHIEHITAMKVLILSFKVFSLSDKCMCSVVIDNLSFANETISLKIAFLHLK